MDQQTVINGMAAQLVETMAERDDARARLTAVMPRIEALEALEAKRASRRKPKPAASTAKAARKK